MGFDNECILNIQSLAGEYFCPVCRLLVYPNEALQSQCTHLYCKPCLTYVVSTTRACPYDGYLVTEADSKPLIESNKALAETIDKIAVHCLYHRSGCTWQGSLSECTTHCAGCAFGNSPVVCNRCGTQIVHRQVQEHAQNCPGVQPLSQQAEGVQDATAASGTTISAEQSKVASTQAGTPASQAQPTQVASAVSAAPPSSGQDQTQTNTSTQPQAAAGTVPTPEQWYQQQQQYQQYYQQYPGYDPYQQHYQNYDPYQQQAQQQYQQHHPQNLPPHAAQGQHQPQVYMQSQPTQQPQLQLQAQPPVRPPVQPQPQTNPQAPIAAQPQMQVQVNPQQQPAQMQLQSHPPPQSHQHPQLYPQAQPQQPPHQPQLHAQPQLQQRPQVPHPQMQHTQPHHLSHPQPHPLPQNQPHPQTQLQQHPHVQPQQQAQPQLQAQPQTRSHSHPHPHLSVQHPSTPAVTGHQSYSQPQTHQQVMPVTPQQHPLHMHPQQGAPQQPPQMRPPHVPMQPQQQSAMPPPPQGQHSNMPPAQQQPVPSQAHQPGQPIHLHHGMNPPQQQPVPQQQVHGHPSQPQLFPGQAPGLVQNHSHQSGPFTQPQLRPQGPPTSLPQHHHANPQLQQNVPVAYGLQPHQSQNHAGRPMMSNHGVHQQVFQQSTGAHAKLVQHSATQSSLNQNYPLRTNVRPQSSSEQQVGYVQHSALQGSSIEATQISSGQVKPEQQGGASLQKTDAKGAHAFQGADSAELRILKSGNVTRSADEEEKSINENVDNSIQLNLAVKDISEASKTLHNDPGLLAQGDDSEEPVVKQMVKEEAAIKSESSTGEQEDAPHSPPKHNENALQEDKESEDIQIQKNPEGPDGKLNKDAADSQMSSMGSVLGASERNNLQAPSLNTDLLQQPPRQNMPGHHERSILHSQFPRQGPGSEEHLPPPPGQIQSNSLLQPGQLVPDRRQLPIHYRPPHMQDRAHHRPPAPDQMLQPSMPPPNQMQVLGQPPSHMRPQGHNSLGAPESFRPPIAAHSHGPFHPGVPTGGFPAPGSSTSFGRGPGMLGPQRSFELQSAPPQGHHSQGHLPPPHGSEGHFGQQHTANPIDSERFANKRPGYFDGRQPDLHLPGSAERVPFGQPGTQPNNMKMSAAPGKELAGGAHDPSFPYGLQDERFKSLPEERYKRLEEEGFNRLPEEHFKSFSVESNRRIVDRREFEEDLKQFPGPGHLDGERVPKFENYFSSSRPLDRVPHDFDRAPHGFNHDVGLKLDGGPSTAASRLLPPYHPGGSSVHSMRPIGFHDDNMGRKIDPTGVHPDFLRRAPETGRHLPPPRSPGREFPRFGPGNQSRLEDIDGRESRVFGERFKSFNLPSDGSGFHDNRFPILPSHLRRGEPDGHLPVHLRSGDLIGPDVLPSHLRGVEPVGSRNFPSHLRIGERGGFPSHLRMGEPGNLPPNPHIGEAIGGSHARAGEPGFSSTYPFRGHPTDGGFFNAGDLESFDQSRKRKHRSMGWCRICKVDCETVEGLELHSQTREHQKIAMDMVLSIKQDSAKKQKPSSDDHVSHEDANKSKKASFESRGSRH